MRKQFFIVIIIFGLIPGFYLYNWMTADATNINSVSPADVRSIAVLPFKNLNKDAEYEYYSTGIVEAINRHLSQINDLKVISLTSTDRFKESEKSVREIGRDLSVTHLLEGSIQRHENLVRFEIRLIDVSTESQVWAENYDRELKDIFKTQSEIAGQVVLALKNTLISGGKKSIESTADRK